MSLLERNYTVVTSDGGGFVESVDGVSGGQEAGQPVDWFYFVNGVEATKGADATNVRSGDRIWWDRHDWSQTETVPAVVGSFPEPFLNGIEGKRLPVRVECASVAGYACRTVAARLRALDVPPAIAPIGSARRARIAARARRAVGAASARPGAAEPRARAARERRVRALLSERADADAARRERPLGRDAAWRQRA